MTSDMKSKNPSPLLVLAVAATLVLAACAGKNDGSSQAQPIAPGTVDPSTAATRGIGSFQGAIVNSDQEAQAILTLDVWQKDGATNAQLTVSPNGATQIIPLNEGDNSFSVDLGIVTVKGTWNGSAWGGVITNGQATNSFTLNSGVSTQAAIAVGAPTGRFDGVLVYKSSGGKRPMSLVLAASDNLADALASTLTSRVSLTGSLNAVGGSSERLTNVVWDRETSTLSADGTIMTSLGTTYLRCKLSEVNSGDKDVLQCALANSKKNSPVASGALSQKRVVVAPPYPAPPTQPNPVPQPTPPPAPTPMPTATPIPAPTPTIIVKNERAFSGSGVFTNEKGAQQTRTLTLTVTLTADPTGADQDAVVKFIVDGSRVGAKFTEATYNSATGDLRAKEILTLGPIAGALKLSCGGVPFATSQYDFVCHYESSVTNVTGEFRLSGKQN